MAQSSPPWRAFESSAGSAERGADASARSATGPGQTSALGIQPVALLGVAAAALIGGLAIVVAITGSGGETVVGPGDGFGVFSTDGVAAVAGDVVVDVTGAVIAPGVYRLSAGSRVGDAITQAGGFSPRVDADRVGTELNLAATLTDGAQIRVPSRDDTVAPAGGGGPGGSGGGAGGSGGAGGALIDLNTASQTELESLPGIGPVTAGKIIESRAGSPFTSIDELRGRGLVGEKTFEDIRALVTVG
jgi:competence protein ComEA